MAKRKGYYLLDMGEYEKIVNNWNKVNKQNEIITINRAIKGQTYMGDKECNFIRQNEDYIVYECSRCKENWVLEDGNPKENEYNYCPKCGSKITNIIELEDEE